MLKHNLVRALLVAPLLACAGEPEGSDPEINRLGGSDQGALGAYVMKIDPRAGTAEITIIGQSSRGLYSDLPFAADGNPLTNPPGTVQAVTTNPREPGVGGCPITDNCFTVTITNFTGQTQTAVYMGIDAINPPIGRALVGPDAVPGGVTAPGGGRNFGTLAAGASSAALSFDIAVPNLDPYTVQGRYWGDDAAITQITTFTGGDPGEGLDFQGVFPYAVNVRGPGGGTVGDATFTADNAAGVTVSAQNEILNWAPPANYGASANDDALEILMNSIRWSAAPNNVDVSLNGLTPGNRYRLQLLFAERCCFRGFAVIVEGSRIADNFAPYLLQGSRTNPANGAAVIYEFTAPDTTLNITLDQPSGGFGDTNPILDALTLEAL